MKLYRVLLIALLACFALTAHSQTVLTSRSWIFFRDKGPDVQGQLRTLAETLPARTLERRRRMGIPLDARDLPVYAPYIAQVEAAGYRVVTASRWLNAVSVEGAPSLAQVRSHCPAAQHMQPVRAAAVHRETPLCYPDPAPLPPPPPPFTYNYGMATDQVQMMNVQYIHQLNKTGRGVLLTICDSGFDNANNINAFDSLWTENRVVAFWDFVNNDNTVFDEDAHGRMVLSTIAALDPGNMVGMAPHVSVLLARTENVASETHQEEDNWVQAMEWADQQGTDIIHSSLGYSVFDQGQGDYTYNDMNGDIATITRAADVAASRGILVVNSAGNEGWSPWHFITAPCDGDSVLCVGAVDPTEVLAGFSSVGPSSDGRTKPDVVCLGQDAAVLDNAGFAGLSSGTSFSAPQVAGLAACLIGAHPNRTNMEVLDAIRRSADRAANPNNDYGWGIPNARAADSLLTEIDVARAEPVKSAFRIFPNPASDQVSIEETTGLYRAESLRLYNSQGAVLLEKSLSGTGFTRERLDISSLSPGVYLLEIRSREGILFPFRFVVSR